MVQKQELYSCQPAEHIKAKTKTQKKREVTYSTSERQGEKTAQYSFSFLCIVYADLLLLYPPHGANQAKSERCKS